LDPLPEEDGMTISRITVVTLGVRDLPLSTAFYEAVFGARRNPDFEGVSFFELPGAWVSLFPLDKLAEDVGPGTAIPPRGFNGVTLAYNARSRDEVHSIFGQAEKVGARIAKPPQETFWGGFGGYFADPDEYCWEVAWGPMFEFAPDGALRFKT
jgi:uncharacterized protein